MLLTATIDDVSAATPRAVLVRVALDAAFPFAAGQAALVGLHGQGERRPYSIAVGPAEAAREGRLEFLIGLGPDGAPGPHLPHAARGVRVDVEGPLGTFSFPEAPVERRFLFVAGGSGIAPMRAMVHHALMAGPDWRLALVYSARTPDELAFDDELRALAAKGRMGYHPTATRHSTESWSGSRGRISKELLNAALENPETLCFVCGPEALVHEVPGMLGELGVAPARIRVEEWGAARTESASYKPTML